MPNARPANPWRAVLTCSLLALALLGVLVAQTRAGRGLSDRLGLSSPATSITELYFAPPTRPAPAASATAAGGSLVSTAFVISNRGRSDRTYDWRIATRPGETISGSTPVPSGQEVRVSRLIWVRCAASGNPASARASRRFLLRVRLAGTGEAITYHGSCRV